MPGNDIASLSSMFVFPDPEKAAPGGLLAVGGNLDPATLLAAYRRGIFPWFEAGSPILWWSPDPRMLLFPGEFHCSRRLGRRLRQARFRFCEDRNFAAVIRACAEREEGTWITAEMIDAYTRLHELGHAHSIEVWEDTRLIGGLYGVKLGRAFFAESMFHRRTDASKMALHHLADKGLREGWLFIDCQFHTPHLASLGAREVPRTEFLELLARALKGSGTRTKNR